MGPAVIAVVSLAFVPVIYSVQSVKLKANAWSVQYGKCLGEQQMALENLAGLRTSARTLRAGWWLMRRWDALGEHSRRALFWSTVWSNLLQTCFQSLGFLLYLAGLYAIFLRYNSLVFSQQQAFAMVGYMGGLLSPINQLASFNSKLIWNAGPVMDVHMYASGKTAPEDALPPPPQPPPQPQPQPPPQQQQQPRRRPTAAAANLPANDLFVGSNSGVKTDPSSSDKGPRIVADNVVFQYHPSATTPTLKGLSAELRPGEYVALCGGSGSGKTTLLRLLGRAVGGATSGSITVDGVPADEYPDTAYCLQSFEVLNGTVRDNIAFGAQHGSDDDVRKAARLAEIAHIIERMPQGYDTVIGRGSSVSMSGGQLARLGLARALCRRPRLLLLDEVTSPLDPETEGQVLATLRALSSQLPLTIVLCTHSVVAASTTDRVVMLADGVVAEIGPFSELVDNRGPFFTLARSHLGDDARDADNAGQGDHKVSREHDKPAEAKADVALHVAIDLGSGPASEQPVSVASIDNAAVVVDVEDATSVPTSRAWTHS